jgi:polyphenol oxidase
LLLQDKAMCYTEFMQSQTRKGVELYRYKILANHQEICHFISTRRGGESKKPYDSLNLAFHVSDKKVDVLRNRTILANLLGISISNFVFMKQVHGDKVAVIGNDERSKGAFSHEDAIDGVDAMITTTPGICLLVQLADCVPVLLFDPEKKIVAAVHAGWRGTMKQITKNTVKKMIQEFGCNPQNIVAGIGPSIGPCCFESKDIELRKKWERIYSEKDRVISVHKEKTGIDLWRANRIQLMRAGVKEENIESAEICTSCNTDDFYSYKKEVKTGRFGAGIMIDSKFKN